MNDIAKAPVAATLASYRSSRAESGPIGWLRNEIDRLFDDFGQPTRNPFNFPARTATNGPVPALELVDDGKDYRLTAELPGLSDEDIDVEVAEGMLTISGEKSEESESKDQGYLLSERCYGSFMRTVTLPADADPNAIEAKFDNGLLTLSIGKDEHFAARKRKIAIGH